MQTNDVGLLFRTDDDLKHDERTRGKAKAATNIGSPVQLSSQIQRIHIIGDDAWTAESGWQARRINLVTGKTQRLYRGHQGPVTDVKSWMDRDSQRRVIATASWDRTVRIWVADTGDLLHVLEGHSDFVKSLAVIQLGFETLLISTSSDRTIRVWVVSNLKDAPRCSSVIKSHTRPVECCAWRTNSSDTSEITRVWTSDSMGIIKRWKVDGLNLVLEEESKAHETSIVDLSLTEEQLLTASMDKTAKLYTQSLRTPVAEFAHTAYAQSICSLPTHNLICTGSDDEAIRIWDATLADEGTAKLIATVEGHSGGVTALCAWTASSDFVLVSGSTDGSLRRWTLDELLHPKPLQVEPVAVTLTEDEERELAELMEE